MKSILLFSLLLFSFSCEVKNHIFNGDILSVRWAPDMFKYLSKEETRDIATKLCKERFNSSSVTFVKRTFGYGEDWDIFQCDPQKASIRPKDSTDTNYLFDEAKQKCLNRGLTENTEEFGECILKLSE